MPTAESNQIIDQLISRFLTIGSRLLIVWAFCLALLSAAHAVYPPPDGGYPNNNTAEGDFALQLLTSFGTDNTAIGTSALYSNTVGDNNTAVGVDALVSNIYSTDNTAIGHLALFNNDKTADAFGNQNTAIGSGALYNNSDGFDNTASGYFALYNNTYGASNTAVGAYSLYTNSASHNTACGYTALFANFGNGNTGVGDAALNSNTTGTNNTVQGYLAVYNNTTGAGNIALGYQAGYNLTTGNNNIDIGNAGVAAESNRIRIGTNGTQTATFVAGIRGVAVAGGQAVLVNANGQLGVAASSARFKEAIKPMEEASEAILHFQPVTFRYKHDLDPDGMPQFGLVAEQVEKVNPDLVVRDEYGKPFSVRYEAVNAMLLNEFLKAHKQLEEQTHINRDLENEIATLEATLKQQSAQIRSVSDQLALDRSAPRRVSNDP